MQVQHWVHQVPQIPTLPNWPYHVFGQCLNCTRLAQALESQGCTVLPQFCELLLSLHLQLLWHSHSFNLFYLQRCPVDFHWLLSYHLSAVKEAFTSAPILVHWIPNALMIVETDASDYAITGIFLIHCIDEEIQLVAYYSWTLSAPELNYDTHNKELLTIHKLFQSWCHYLEGLAELVNIVTDHKNLKYFSATKLLTQQ